MVAPGELLARSRDLVVVYGPRGDIEYRNASAAARTLDTALATLALKVAASGEPESHEWGETSASGIIAWFSTELTPAPEGRVIAISRDITANRRREQLMVDTHGVAHLGTWEWDVSMPNATWSAELYRIYGLTPATYTPSYEAYLTKVHPDDRQRVIDATNRVFHEHVPYSHDERILRPDGTVRWLHTWAYPVLDATGKLTHLIGVCQDITDRALVEEQLQRLNAELEERVRDRTLELENANVELEAFNTMVSHDLRSPLSAIQMSADLLAPRVADDERGRTHVDRIRRATRNMSTLMDDLLAFARVGHGALQPARIDLSTTAADVFAELRTAQPDRDVTTAVAPDLACDADPRLFRMVIANLLGNAWKYTARAQNGCIEIGRTEHAGAPALFVRDNGIGFAPGDAARLFAPFERAANAIELPGSGIGLAIVQRIVERHGGHIAAEGELGRGATFYVTLPGCRWI